jgi:hypothetical protein
MIDTIARGAQVEVDAKWESYWRDKVEETLQVELVGCKPMKKPEEDEIKRFVAWCAQDGISHRPAAPSIVAAYLLCRVEDDLAAGKPINAAKFTRITSALRHYHSLWDLADPTETPLVRAALAFIRGRARNLQPSKEESKNGKIHKNNH